MSADDDRLWVRPGEETDLGEELALDLAAALPVVLLFVMVGFVAWMGRAQW
jgi:hypothetical protein